MLRAASSELITDPHAATPTCREQILDACGIDGNLTDGAWAESPAPSAADAPSSSSSSSSSSSTSTGGSAGSGSGANSTLPDGRVALFLSIAAGPVPCYNYTPGGERNWTADPAAGLWSEWRGADWSTLRAIGGLAVAFGRLRFTWHACNKPASAADLKPHPLRRTLPQLSFALQRAPAAPHHRKLFWM